MVAEHGTYDIPPAGFAPVILMPTADVLAILGALRVR
jgi:hypothetical protein